MYIYEYSKNKLKYVFYYSWFFLIYIKLRYKVFLSFKKDWKEIIKILIIDYIKCIEK